MPEAGAKFPVLVSYAYAREAGRDFALIADRDDVELLIDCGAFTALNTGEEIKLSDYMAFLRQWGDRLFGYLALDVIGDPVGTERNLATMLDAGFKPIPVHVRGDDQDRMNRLFELSDWVACGGLRRPHAGHSSKAYVKQKMIWSRGRKVHWLGYTDQAMIRAFKPYSCDCSNWSRGHRWGLLDFYIGDLAWTHRGNLDMGCLKKPFTRKEAAVLAELGITTERARDLSLWTSKCPRDQSIPGTVTSYSWVKYIRDVRAMIGTRVFLATGEFKILSQLIEMTA